MTKCIGSPAQEMAEQYLVGGLPEAEAERFEDHYFGCDLCHEHLLTLKEIREAMIREPIAIVAAPTEPARIAPRQSFGARMLAFPVPLAVLASIAAALLVGAVLVGIQRSSPVLQPGHGAASSTAAAKAPPQPADSGNPGAISEAAAPAKSDGVSVPVAQARPAETELALLADLQLPGYQQPQLRGEEAANSDHAQFSSGMQAYAQGDCGSALGTLAQVPETAADGIAAKLYSGLCQLQGRELEGAQASLTAVVDAGDTPELETAEYFLAQTRLLRGDAQGAKDWLTRAIALHGDYEDRAQKQVALLPR
jgi:anti-sigma factor RsiW